MSHKFPIYSASRKIGNKGVTFVRNIVENQFEWVFRPTHLEDDFGIDAYFDVVGDHDSFTGKYLGVQIKTGKSYFKNLNPIGWKYIGENKHLNYFLNSNFPILLVIVDVDIQQAFWVEFDINKTEKTPSGWSIVIPNENILDLSAKPKFKTLVGEEIDYMPQIEYQWELNEKIKDSSLTVLSVSKDEIIAKDVSGFMTLLSKLTMNQEIIAKSRGKITFIIDGFDEDEREIYEIPEIRSWIKHVIPIFKYWGYFLNMESYFKNISGLTMIHVCSVDLKEIATFKEEGKKYVEPDIEQTINLMNELFGWLNEFTDKYKIPLKTNKRQSYLITKILLGEELAKRMHNI